MFAISQKQFNILVITAIILFSFFSWWPTRNLPYHWDSAGFVINSAYRLLQTRFQPLIVPDSDFAHPPLLIGLLALTWKVFGDQRLISHLLMFPLLPMYLISVYYLTKKLFNQPTSVVTTILSATTPVVIAEYGMVYLDLPMAALTVFGLALWAYNKNWSSAVVFTLASLIKIPVLGIVLGLIIWHVSKKEYKKAVPFLVPFAGFTVWLIYHFSVEHWWLARPGRLAGSPKSLITFLSSLGFFINKFFLEQGRIFISISGAACFLYLIFTRAQKSIGKLYLPLVLLTTASLLFIYTGEFGARYAIFMYPLLYGICIYGFYTVLKLQNLAKWFFPLTGVLLLIFLSQWHPKLSPSMSFDIRPTENLAYQDMISIGVQMSRFAEKYYPNASYFGAFPEAYQLTQPYQGYVQKPLRYYDCPKFELNSNVQQIFVFHTYSPIQITCNQILQNLAVASVRRFEVNGKWVELLLVNATESAKMVKPPKKT